MRKVLVSFVLVFRHVRFFVSCRSHISFLSFFYFLSFFIFFVFFLYVLSRHGKICRSCGGLCVCKNTITNLMSKGALALHRRSKHHMACRNLFRYRPVLRGLPRRPPPNLWKSVDLWGVLARLAFASYYSRVKGALPGCNFFSVTVHFLWHWLNLHKMYIVKAYERKHNVTVDLDDAPAGLLRVFKKAELMCGW